MKAADIIIKTENVKKRYKTGEEVLWALKGVGRRSPVLRREAVALARKLAASDVPSARFIGRDALRDLTRKQETKKGKGPQK